MLWCSDKIATSIAAKAVAVVASPAVESAKIGLVCSATRPWQQTHKHISNMKCFRSASSSALD